MKRIGNTFAAELAAASLAGLPISWGSDGQINFSDAVSEANKVAVLAVLEAHDPKVGDIAEKWDAIKAERDRRKSGGVKVGTKWYHTDADSRIQYLGLKDQARDLLAAGQPDTTRLQKLGQDVRWKTMDGSFIYLTVKHAFDIVAAVGDLDALAFTAAETHRVAMEASADPASYDFSAGWPATFPG